MNSKTFNKIKSMKLENQVVSLDLSRRLKELGVKQESLFWWAEEKLTGWNNQDWKWVVTDSTYEGDYEQYRNITSAFTVAELERCCQRK